MALKNCNGANLQGELSHVIRQLQACSLTPGTEPSLQVINLCPGDNVVKVDNHSD